MRYGFTDKGFTAVDDANRIGEFAYATSPYWQRARKNPARTAAEMLAKTWKEAPAHLREQHYVMACEQLSLTTAAAN